MSELVIENKHNNVYTNTQNVHDHNVQLSILDAVRYLLQQNIEKYDKNKLKLFSFITSSV